MRSIRNELTGPFTFKDSVHVLQAASDEPGTDEPVPETWEDHRDVFMGRAEARF